MNFMRMVGLPEIVFLALGLGSLLWYVAVLVLLFKIWGKVKRLPSA